MSSIHLPLLRVRSAGPAQQSFAIRGLRSRTRTLSAGAFGSRRGRAAVLASVGILVASLALSGGTVAADPILHEYFVPNAKEDIDLGATTPGGRLLAAIPGVDGPIAAPDVDRDPYASRTTYGGATGAAEDRSNYRIDRSTARPDSVSYHEPFIPSIAPFKRLFAYDAVSDQLELVVADPTLERLEVGGEPLPGEDQFYGDLAVEVVPGAAVRIPSVGPGARVLAANVSPPVPFQLYRDGAENWFLKSSARQRVRLTLQLAIERAVFGSRFADVSYANLRSTLPKLPRAVLGPASRVARHIGLTENTSPARAVELLVEYFREFEPSADFPEAGGGAPLYEELSLTQKGVCRHRAYGFVITALRQGIPSRMARNEAHAWVEVFDGRRWHRIDLGGAASHVELEREAHYEPYRAPQDQFHWPESSESGEQMVDRSLDARADTANGTSSGAADAGRMPPPPLAPPHPDLHAQGASRAPASLRATVGAARVKRGHVVQVRGEFRSDSGPCPHARVDVQLAVLGRKPLHVQSLATDADGRFDHGVTIPMDMPVGEYRVVLSSPGSVVCAPARLE